MKKAFILTALMLIVAIPAFASGVGLAWNDCFGGGGASNMAFACNKNSGAENMYVSFATSADQPLCLGVEVYMRGMVEATDVPDWWKMGLASSTDCRKGTFVPGASFLTGPYGCADPWAGSAMGGLAAYAYNLGPGLIRAQIGYAVAAGVPIVAETEYYACGISILNTKTVGTGACAGCTTPAIWAINELKAAQLLDFEWMTTPLAEGSQCVTWRGSTLECGRPVPVRNTTWGQVKSLYR